MSCYKLSSCNRTCINVDYSSSSVACYIVSVYRRNTEQKYVYVCVFARVHILMCVRNHILLFECYTSICFINNRMLDV
jgi:hypothetical protein